MTGFWGNVKIYQIHYRMSDAGDEIPVEAATVEVAAEVSPKGKLSVEDALQVCVFFFYTLSLIKCSKFY